MLTVIFFQKASQPFIDRYKSLFQPYIDERKIDFCFWDEYGLLPKDTVKELSGIVHGVKEWRALVVLPFNEDPAQKENPYLKADEDNPFDYLCNRNPDPLFKESDIPLIRLSQMLGGIPLVNHHYRTNAEGRLVIEEDRETLQEYQKIWDDLDEKYSLPYDKPAELYLFSARHRSKNVLPAITDIEMMERNEIDSSMFWYRNRYPAKARFLVQDCALPGHAHYAEDLFGFWMTALTIALNPMPTGILEAYKLYHVKASVSKEEIRRLFSDYYHRLSGIRFAAQKQVVELRKQAQMQRTQDNLPVYKMDVPVWYTNVTEEGLFISSERIGLAGDCPEKEEPWWNRKVSESMKALAKVYRNLQIELDMASGYAKISSAVNDSEIVELDEYQYKEMSDQLNDLEKEILVFNTNAVLPKIKHKKDLTEAKKEAAESMRKRMSRKMTVTAGMIGIGIFIVSYFPDVAYQLLDGGSFLNMLGTALAGGLIMGIALVGALFDFRAIIQSKISGYNSVMSRVTEDIKHSSQVFSEYLGKCCSFMRGMDMLQALEKKNTTSTEGIVTMTRHINQLSSRISLIEDWMKDFELKPMPEDGSFRRIVFDYEIDPQRNNGYLIDTSEFIPYVPGPGGSRIQPPYTYIKELQIERIPVFEKVPVKNYSEEENE